MFITGPDVVKTVTGEDVTLEELGGAMSHASKSGVCHFVAPDEKACLEDVRFLLGVPARRTTWRKRRRWTVRRRPRIGCARRCNELLPPSPNQPYDMKKVVREVVDDGEFFEYQANWAKSIICGFSAGWTGRPSASSATSR